MRLAALLFTLLVARHAGACRCAVADFVSPLDGATDVPLNVQLVAERHSFFDESAIALADDRGDPVPLAPAERGLMTVATPASLAPDTAYVATVGGATLRFTTGNWLDATPPERAGLQAFTPERMPWEGFASCEVAQDGVLSRVRLAHDAVPDAVRYELVIAPDVVVALRPDHPDVLGSRLCGPQVPAFEAGVTYCARLSAFDGAGNASGGEMEVCGVARECAFAEDLGRPAHACVPPSSSGCAVGRGGAPAPIALAVLWWLAARRRSAATSPAL